MEEKIMGATEARQEFTTLIDDLTQPILIFKNNRPVAVVMSYQDYLKIKARAACADVKDAS